MKTNDMARCVFNHGCDNFTLNKLYKVSDASLGRLVIDDDRGRTTSIQTWRFEKVYPAGEAPQVFHSHYSVRFVEGNGPWLLLARWTSFTQYDINETDHVRDTHKFQSFTSALRTVQTVRKLNTGFYPMAVVSLSERGQIVQPRIWKEGDGLTTDLLKLIADDRMQELKRMELLEKELAP